MSGSSWPFLRGLNRTSRTEFDVGTRGVRLQAVWLAPPMGHPDSRRRDSCGNLGGRHPRIEAQTSSSARSARRSRNRRRRSEARQQPKLPHHQHARKGPRRERPRKQRRKQPRKHLEVTRAAMRQPPRHKRRQRRESPTKRLGTCEQTRPGSRTRPEGRRRPSGCRRRTRRSRAGHSRGAGPGTGSRPGCVPKHRAAWRVRRPSHLRHLRPKPSRRTRSFAGESCSTGRLERSTNGGQDVGARGVPAANRSDCCPRSQRDHRHRHHRRRPPVPHRGPGEDLES